MTELRIWPILSTISLTRRVRSIVWPGWVNGSVQIMLSVALSIARRTNCGWGSSGAVDEARLVSPIAISSNGKVRSDLLVDW